MLEVMNPREFLKAYEKSHCGRISKCFKSLRRIEFLVEQYKTMHHDLSRHFVFKTKKQRAEAEEAKTACINALLRFQSFSKHPWEKAFHVIFFVNKENQIYDLCLKMYKEFTSELEIK